VERLKALLGRVQGTVPVRVVQRYGEDDGGIWATVIAWNALTAIFPIVLFLIAIAGFVLSAAGISTDTLLNGVVAVFPSDPKSQQAALKGIKGVQEKAGIFVLVGLVGYLWTASNLFGAMEMAFDSVLHCGRRPFIRQKLMAIGMMAIFSVLAVIGVATSVLLPLLSRIPGIPTSVLDLLNSPLQFAIGVASGFVLFFTLYFVVPNRRQPLKHIWPGALLAGLAFKLLTLLFPLYLQLNAGINQFGASFAFLFVMLAFFFFLGLITMFGIELNAVLFESSARPVPSRPLPGVTPIPGRGARLRGPRRALMALAAVAIGLFASSRQPGNR
jgi:membrane protein